MSKPISILFLALIMLFACSSPEDQAKEAAALIKAGKTKEALAFLNKAIEKFPKYPTDPKYAEAFYQRGLAMSALGKSESYETGTNFRTCAQLKPNHLECVFEHGKRGSSSGMFKAMNKVIEMDPKRWVAYKLRARGRVAQKKFQGIEGDLKIYLENRPRMDAKAKQKDELEINRIRSALAASKGDFILAYELRGRAGPDLDTYDGDRTWSWVQHGLKESARGGNGRAKAILGKLGLSTNSFLDEAKALYRRGKFESAHAAARTHYFASDWMNKKDKDAFALFNAYKAAWSITEGNKIKPLAKGKDFRKESNRQKEWYNKAIRNAKTSIKERETPLGYRLRAEANCRRGYFTDGFKDVDKALALKPGDGETKKIRELCVAFKKIQVSSSGSSTSSSSSSASTADKFRKLRRKIKKRRSRKR